jgi:hypothetical protein
MRYDVSSRTWCPLAMSPNDDLSSDEQDLVGFNFNLFGNIFSFGSSFGTIRLKAFPFPSADFKMVC